MFLRLMNGGPKRKVRGMMCERVKVDVLSGGSECVYVLFSVVFCSIWYCVGYVYVCC